MESGAWVQILPQLFKCCVTLAKSLSLPVPQFPHLQNGAVLPTSQVCSRTK